MSYDSAELLSFWFGPRPLRAEDITARMKTWFGGNAEFDRALAERFAGVARAAAHGELRGWAAEARPRLALILALDQLPRNIYRGDALAFAQDAQALALTQEGMSSGLDQALLPLERLFFYMPLQHSEDRAVQETSVATYEQLARETDELHRATLNGALDYAKQHRDLIARFGRFPHRNRALNRHSTEDEQLFLARGGATFGQ